MALSLQVETPAGVKMTYWRITRIEANIQTGGIEYRVGGYLSKKVRDAGKIPVQEKLYTFLDESAVLKSGGNIMAILYSDLKEREEYNDATDVLEDA